ncbi:DnaA ATPase domain-containing protein [Mycoplasma phocimorsus]|uniref:DnaA ATPase domain-containing protein n=1 Tax=Mycoplasma phocimorsus TaxID=3045839 RepID=UPI0024C0D0CD|nr:DnaA/Hda family protein [Mycoplasma phocimorsus]MDJ1647341.1 DnaA/Hda family protein [Mycoplasma phocimorsus]
MNSKDYISLLNEKFQLHAAGLDIDEIVYKNIIKKLEIVDLKENTIYFYINNSPSFKICKDDVEIILKKNIKYIDENLINFEIVHDLNKKDKTLEETQLKNEQVEEQAFKITVKQNLDLNPELSLKNYYVGKFNKTPYTVAKKIIDSTLTTNMIFIVGTHGVGKTHLVNAICLELEQKGLTVQIIKTSKQNEFSMLLKRNMPEEKAEYISNYLLPDLLVIDDLQEYKTKVKTFEFLNDIIEARKDNNKLTIICASERAELLKESFNERLVNKLVEGVTVEIKKPSVDEMYKILIFMLKNANWDINKFEKCTLNSLINLNVNTINKLKGYLVTLNMFETNIKKHDVYSKEILSKYINELNNNNEINEDKIIKTIANYYNIDAKKMLGSSRIKTIVRARHFLVYFLKNKLKYKQIKIGKLLNKNHSTIVYILKEMEIKKEEKESIRSAISAIDNLIEN